MLKPETVKIIEELAKKYDLKLVMLFGSVAKENMREKSDIDIAVLPSDQKFYEKDFASFTYDLMEAEDMEKREIEVVPISSENPLLLYHIFYYGKPLYIKNKEKWPEIRSWARFTYEDNQRFFYGREKLLEKKIKALN